MGNVGFEGGVFWLWLFISISTIAIGFPFAIMGWVVVLERAGLAPVSNSDRPIWTSLKLFTLAVVLNSFWFLLVWVLGRAFGINIWPYVSMTNELARYIGVSTVLLLILASFVSLVASANRLHGNYGKGKGIVKAGAVTLLVVDLLWFTWFILALPGMPLHD